MNHRIQWLLVSAVALAPLSWGCSSDESPAATGGSGGSGGSSGSTGTAGTAGGTGGSAGTGGASGAGGSSRDAATDVSADSNAPDGARDGGSDATEAGEGGTFAFIRVAHLSPGAPAIDVCLRPRAAAGDGGEAGVDAASDAADATDGAMADAADGSDGSDGSADAGADATDGGNDGFTIGPVFKGLGVTAGLAYTQVSSYLSVPPGAYDVRIVAPNSPNCRTALGGLPDTTLDVVAVGTYSTFAAIGVINSDAGQEFQLRRYLDERAVTAGSGKLRFIHAAPGVPNVDVGVGTAESFIAIFDNVPFGGVGVGTGVDVAGYVETPPVSNQTLVARIHAIPTDVLAIPGFTLAAGQISSAFAVGVASSVTAPLKVLVCNDLDNSKAPLSNCGVLP